MSKTKLVIQQIIICDTDEVDDIIYTFEQEADNVQHVYDTLEVEVISQEELSDDS